MFLETAKVRQSHGSNALTPSRTSRRILLTGGPMAVVVALCVAVALVVPGPKPVLASSTVKEQTNSLSFDQPARLPSVNVAEAAARALQLRNERIRLWLASPVVQMQIWLGALKGPSPWDGLARCESGLQWHRQGSLRGGGLGYTNTVWLSFIHGRDPNNGRRIGNDYVADFGFPELPGLATREQQIVVAERERIWNGGTAVGAWGCGAYYGK